MDTFPSKIEEFWDLIADAWQHGYMGVDFGRIFIALAILSTALLLRRAFSRLILSRLPALMTRMGLKFGRTMADALDAPLRLVTVAIGVFIVTQYLEPAGTLEVFADRINRTLIIIVLFWGLYRLVQPVSTSLGGLREVLSSALVDSFAKFVRTAIVVIAGATVLEMWGIKVAPILAGFGLLGVAVALGAQDLFKNLIAGLLILAEKRFNVGDWILADGIVEGDVESIGFRSTVIRRFDKAPAYVPNAKLADSAATNFSAMTHRRIYWVLGVHQDTTVP